MVFHTITEPFRIHSVELLRVNSEAERGAAIEEVGRNLFGLHAASEVCSAVAERREGLRGLRIVDEPPALRRFTARFEPV
ncbi:MAG TPA: hypothetical protein VJ986_01890 [Gaiellaceae bacterium]|nr:hypothetical protein [Gaiellaceae bacterium]